MQVQLLLADGSFTAVIVIVQEALALRGFGVFSVRIRNLHHNVLEASETSLEVAYFSLEASLLGLNAADLLHETSFDFGELRVLLTNEPCLRRISAAPDIEHELQSEDEIFHDVNADHGERGYG